MRTTYAEAFERTLGISPAHGVARRIGRGGRSGRRRRARRHESRTIATNGSICCWRRASSRSSAATGRKSSTTIRRRRRRWRKSSRSQHGYDVAERFELYYRGIELANGFHELADAAEQRRRFEAVNAARVADGRRCPAAARDVCSPRWNTACPIAPASRWASIGWRCWRSVRTSIDDVIAFPQEYVSASHATRPTSLQPRHGLVPKARHQVVVDHADGLHVGVDDRAADELEAALLEVFAQRVGFLRRRRQMSFMRSSRF